VLCGRFRIVRLIGKGGMGEVYEAWDLELQEAVALKTLRFEVSGSEIFSARFRREVQLARKVTHPNVCRIFDSFRHQVGNEAPIAVLSMELLRGETLSEHLKKKGRLTTEEALPLVRQIVDGLQAVHDAGIIHRDLKPSNLMLVPEGDGYCVKLTDFGIAGRLSAEPTLTALTQGSKALGTPDYMAPEQLENGRTSVQSDIYSLGLILYEMVTGLKPFAGKSAWKRLYDNPVPPKKLTPDLPDYWNNAVLCCLDRNVEQRLSTTSILWECLDGRRPRSGKKHINLLLLMVACLILIAAAEIFIKINHRPSTGIPAEAQMAFDRAKLEIGTESRDGFLNGIEDYKKATSIQPNWAAAWADLAYAYATANNFRYLDGRTALRESRRAAEQAIRLDPKLARAYGALGWSESLDFDNWPQAEDAFQTALRLDPNDGQIHYWFGVHLRKKGRFREAEAHDKLALQLTHELDPNLWCELAFLYWTSGQLPKLKIHLEQQLRVFPNFATTRFLDARLQKLEGHFEAANDELSFAQKLGLNRMTVLVERASLELAEGHPSRAREYVKALEDAGRTQEIDGLLLAGVLADLGDKDSAFQILNDAARKRYFTLLSAPASPVLIPLRNDPRFKSLLERLHYSDQIMQQMEFSSSSSSGRSIQPSRTGTS